MCINNRLKEVCDAKGLKLKDFIDITGLPYRTGQSYLSGAREPNADGMRIICTQMCVNVNWLLTGKGAMFISDAGNEQSLSEIEGAILHSFRCTNDIGKKAIIAIASVVEELK